MAASAPAYPSDRARVPLFPPDPPSARSARACTASAASSLFATHRMLFPFGVLIAGLSLEWLLPIGEIPGNVDLALGGVLFLYGALLIALAARTLCSGDGGLVSTGLYGWSRHPMYLGMSLAYLGTGLVLDSLWAVLMAPAVFLVLDRAIVPDEERALERRFGAVHREYRARTRRWL